ncbi:MAG: type II toxin-antitoxin system RelB/DinJ family antitoxin [Bacillota bacterium]|nr:type II toxin-antitoxin system RelB/DinJ family antitoxin [Bacillota bacterium]
MAQLSMRIDDNVKKKAEEACEALGLNMTTAINLYLVKLGNEMRIPFEVAVDPFYSNKNRDILEKPIRQLKQGHGAGQE